MYNLLYNIIYIRIGYCNTHYNCQFLQKLYLYFKERCLLQNIYFVKKILFIMLLYYIKARIRVTSSFAKTPLKSLVHDFLCVYIHVYAEKAKRNLHESHMVNLV